MTKANITAIEANDIQAQWMGLDSNAPEKEKQRVFALMKKLPRSHITVSPDGSAMLIIHGQPAHAFNEPIEDSVKRAKALGVQTQLRWSTTGVWIDAAQLAIA